MLRSPCLRSECEHPRRCALICCLHMNSNIMEALGYYRNTTAADLVDLEAVLEQSIAAIFWRGQSSLLSGSKHDNSTSSLLSCCARRQ